MKRSSWGLLIVLLLATVGLADTASEKLSTYLSSVPVVTTSTTPTTDIVNIITGMTTTPVIKQITISNLAALLGGGTVTSVTASSPLSSSQGTTPNITCGTASASTNGCLSSADWTAFNAKQPAGSYVTQTTTVNGHALSSNVSVTTADLGISFPLTAAQVVNDTISGSKCLHTSGDGASITLAASDCGSGGGEGGVTGVSATAPITSTGGTAPVIACNTASATQPGCLAAADWSVFNAKQPALGYTPENAANKGIASGYAGLDSSAKFPWTSISGAPTMPSGTILGTTDSQVISNKSFGAGMTWPTFNQTTTGTSAGITDQYIDWNATSGGTSIKNKPLLSTSKTTVLTASSGTVTTQSTTTKLNIIILAGGGGGGAVTVGNGNYMTLGGGGQAGGFLESYDVSVSGSTGYSYVVGSGGASAAAGNDSSLTVGGAVYSAKGGQPGGSGVNSAAGVSVVLGGQGTTAGSGGDINNYGSFGGNAVGSADSLGVSGRGADSMTGVGGKEGKLTTSGKVNGGNAVGYGGGGGGGVALGVSNTATGGTGSQGVIIINER